VRVRETDDGEIVNFHCRVDPHLPPLHTDALKLKALPRAPLAVEAMADRDAHRLARVEGRQLAASALRAALDHGRAPFAASAGRLRLGGSGWNVA
jgi:hypothetical protein